MDAKVILFYALIVALAVVTALFIYAKIRENAARPKKGGGGGPTWTDPSVDDGIPDDLQRQPKVHRKKE